MPDDLLLTLLQQRIAGVSAYFDQNAYLDRLHLRFRTPLYGDEARAVQQWVLREGQGWLLESSGLHYPTMGLVALTFVRGSNG